MGGAVFHMLTHPEMVIGHCRHERLVGDAEHLTLTGQGLKQIGHRSTDASADAGINLIEQKRAGAIHSGKGGLEREQKTGQGKLDELKKNSKTSTEKLQDKFNEYLSKNPEKRDMSLEDYVCMKLKIQ